VEHTLQGKSNQHPTEIRRGIKAESRSGVTSQPTKDPLVPNRDWERHKGLEREWGDKPNSQRSH
jgi:hypothetical protein